MAKIPGIPDPSTRADFLKALDEYIDARTDFTQATRQVQAMEYRFQAHSPANLAYNADDLEKVRHSRNKKEKFFKEKRHNLNNRLERLFG